MQDEDNKERAENTPERVFPSGDYAIVEIMGHQTMVGRIEEVTRFGISMLQIEPIFAGNILPAILQGGAAIYRLTPCSAETAFRTAPKEGQRWAVPEAVRTLLPPLALAKPDPLEIDPGAFVSGDDESELGSEEGDGLVDFDLA